MNEPILDEKSKEAVHAARDAAQAVEVARQQQLDEAKQAALERAERLAAAIAIEKLSDEARLGQIVSNSIEEAFRMKNDDGRPRYMDLNRALLICQSIVGIDHRLTAIESNIVWGVRIVIGAVIVAVLGLIFVK